MYSCRLYLAALHFNENTEREQAATQKGDMCCTVHYPRSKRGDFTARPVKTAATFGEWHSLEFFAVFEHEK